MLKEQQMSSLMFATSREDAVEFCNRAQITFDETIWVFNVQLLGDMNVEGLPVRYTDQFKQMPAYQEAAIRFGERDELGQLIVEDETPEKKEQREKMETLRRLAEEMGVTVVEEDQEG